MNQSLTVLAINALLVGTFLLAAVATFKLLVRSPLLLWMIAALVLGGIDIVATILNDNPSPLFASVGIALNIASALCIARIAMVNEGAARRWPVTTIPAMIMGIGACTALFAGSVYLGGALPLQVAAALPLLETAWRFMRVSPRTPLESALAAVFFIGAANFLARIPVLVLFMDWNAPRETVLAWRPMSLSLYLVTVLLTVAMLLLLALVVRKVMMEYRERSELDSLTGIPNRRGFEDRYATASARGGIFILADIDHFKRVNDNHGHIAGDRVICAFAHLLAQVGVTAGRLGGEEFAVFLPGATLDQGRMVAEGLRTAFSLQQVECDQLLIQCTASFGITPATPGEPLDPVFARADAALYRAKNTGRNRVCMTTPRPHRYVIPDELKAAVA